MHKATNQAPGELPARAISGANAPEPDPRPQAGPSPAPVPPDAPAPGDPQARPGAAPGGDPWPTFEAQQARSRIDLQTRTADQVLREVLLQQARAWRLVLPGEVLRAFLDVVREEASGAVRHALLRALARVESAAKTQRDQVESAARAMAVAS